MDVGVPGRMRGQCSMVCCTSCARAVPGLICPALIHRAPPAMTDSNSGSSPEDIRQIVRNSHCAPQQNQHTGKMDKAQVILCFHFPTDQHAPERWQPAEETFHLPAAFLSAERSSVLGLILTIASMGCNYFQ